MGPNVRNSFKARSSRHFTPEPQEVFARSARLIDKVPSVSRSGSRSGPRDNPHRRLTDRTASTPDRLRLEKRRLSPGSHRPASGGKLTSQGASGRIYGVSAQALSNRIKAAAAGLGVSLEQVQVLYGDTLFPGGQMG